MSASDTIIYTDQEWKTFFSDLSYSKLIVLTDDQTQKHCLPIFQAHLHGHEFLHINVKGGEKSKSIDNAQYVWKKLLNAAIDRDAILICLGGGVVSDLGGYAASCYKRGIRLINVPTTHLAMTDAALGGKNAINFGGLKNQIGTVLPPIVVWINTAFLSSLPKRELLSGWVETVKHALIADREFWNIIRVTPIDDLILDNEVLKKSALIKNAIAAQDPMDKGIRQALNFGHTIGHALEANSKLLHGEAIAFGLLAESYLSNKICGLPEDDLYAISTYLQCYKDPLSGAQIDHHALIDRMSNDKKNLNGRVRFSLIANIGEPKVGLNATLEQMESAISFAKKQLLT
ncbi:MAG: 3-dehydroquinate synthase [Salibacteraceae bacterium]